MNFFKLCNAILSWENLTVSTRRTLRACRDQQMNKLERYSKERYNFQRPGREGPLIIENHQSPVLGALCSHKYITSLLMASRELLPMGQGGAAGEEGAGLCGSSVLRKRAMSQEPGICFGAQHTTPWEVGYLSSIHWSTPRSGKVQLASLWKSLPPISYEKIVLVELALRWSTWTAAMHSRLPTGRSKMPVAIFHDLNVLVIQPVPNGKDKFDYNWI